MNKKAFTLIELLVVVLIIGILAAVALPQYQKVVIKSKAVALLPRLKAIHSAQKIYHMENDRYIGDIRNLPGHDLALSDEQKYNGGLWHIKTLDGFWVSASLFWIAVIGTDQIEWRISNTDDLYCCARKANKAAMDICKSYGSNAATDTVCGAGEFWCRCGIIQL